MGPPAVIALVVLAATAGTVAAGFAAALVGAALATGTAWEVAARRGGALPPPALAPEPPRAPDPDADLVAEHAAMERVALAVATEPDPDVVFALVSDEVAALLGVEAALVARFDTRRATPVGRSAALHPALGESMPLDGPGALAQVHRHDRPAHVADYAEIDPATEVAHLAERSGYRTSVAAPIRVGGRLWGALLAASAFVGAMPADAERRLGRMAELLDAAIAQAALRRELAARADEDPVTGLANHRRFHEALATSLREAEAHGSPLTVALIDPDHLRVVNETHGHATGDAVLAEIGSRLASRAGRRDTVARLGAQFGWILPGLDAAAASGPVEAARRAVGAAPYARAGGLTASAGICDTAAAPGAARLMRLTEGALYAAKAAGRDRLQRYSPEEVPDLSAQEHADRLERARALAGLEALARAVDARDHATDRHSARVADLAEQIAERLGWSGPAITRLRQAARVHDVGKIALPDSALHGPSHDARADGVLARHPVVGADMLATLLDEDQVAWVRHHHEAWDGSGVPDGLRGEEIPEGARILAVAEAWDSMTVSGPAPLPPAAAILECVRASGGRFWPPAVEALLALRPGGAAAA